MYSESCETTRLPLWELWRGVELMCVIGPTTHRDARATALRLVWPKARAPGTWALVEVKP